jgi:hypothetical protein
VTGRAAGIAAQGVVSPPTYALTMPLSPFGERVARNRRFHQPERDG